MEQQIDLLSDIQDGLNTEPVSTGIRFADYILDFIGFYILCLLCGILLGILAHEYINNQFLLYIITYLIYVMYYTVLEGVTEGRTLGKLITGSKAVREDGGTITWNDAFMRSLSRTVPFEAFSGLNGNPWHDSWTHTLVVKKERLPY